MWKGSIVERGSWASIYLSQLVALLLMSWVLEAALSFVLGHLPSRPWPAGWMGSSRMHGKRWILAKMYKSVRAGMGVCFLFLRHNNPLRLTRISQSSFTPILPFPGECSESLILCGKLRIISLGGGGSCPQNSYLSLKTQGTVPILPAGCGGSEYEAHTLLNSLALWRVRKYGQWIPA